jgi:hypothetical protein
MGLMESVLETKVSHPGSFRNETFQQLDPDQELHLSCFLAR